MSTRAERHEAMLRYEAAARAGRSSNDELTELYFAATAGLAEEAAEEGATLRKRRKARRRVVQRDLFSLAGMEARE